MIVFALACPRLELNLHLDGVADLQTDRVGLTTKRNLVHLDRQDRTDREVRKLLSGDKLDEPPPLRPNTWTTGTNASSSHVLVLLYRSSQGLHQLLQHGSTGVGVNQAGTLRPCGVLNELNAPFDACKLLLHLDLLLVRLQVICNLGELVIE